MSANKFREYKKKLSAVCGENNLVYRLRTNTYPITLTIRPSTGIEDQISMLENAEGGNYISPDASIVFYLQDGEVSYKVSSNFTITDTLFNKLKNLFKNLYTYFLQFFFADIVVHGKLMTYELPVIPEEEPDRFEDETIDQECAALKGNEE